MNIGIFSKFDMAGGSEFRCAELANAIAKYTFHNSFLLAEKKLPVRIKSIISESVTICENVLSDVKKLYEMDCIIIVNTDCKDFSVMGYWDGKTKRHSQKIDVNRIGKMVFLYNYLVSPSRHLHTIRQRCKDVRIIVTNSKFYNEITQQDRYRLVRHFPRLRLESPIDPDSVGDYKFESKKIRIGCHSKGASSKWNSDYPELIKRINGKYIGKISWHFMGMNSKVADGIRDIPNVTVQKEFTLPVKTFLQNVDVFLFFPSWGREEPWSRAVAEGIMSGCPVVTTNRGGNKDQVVHGNNGFLCSDLLEIYNALEFFIRKPDLVRAMGKNSRIYARSFSSENIILRLLDFVE